MINVFKYFYSKNTLKGKVLRIIDEIKVVVTKKTNEKIRIFHYGAYKIDPIHLSIWVCVKSDKTKQSLIRNDDLLPRLKQLLNKYNYPTMARDLVYIGIESQETVDRVSGGNWFLHFK